MAGLALALAAALALVVSNSGWGDAYRAMLEWPLALRLGSDWLVLSKPLLHWVNDLWMAAFFFLVGLEIKRELLQGDLASPRQAMLPMGAALGGMAVPALIYAAVNAGDPVTLRGWAIPAATDIAFALGILALLGSRVPVSLKVFLTAVAIIDDLGAILIIAFFYTSELSMTALAAAGGGVLGLLLLNRARVMAISPYVALGLLVWFFVYKSGVQATLAGVVTALAIPLAGPSGGSAGSPLLRAEHALQPWVAFFILPVFAFVNAGVSLQDFVLADLLGPVPLGIAAGLLLGKTLGVMGAVWLMVRFAGASLPARASWRQMFGVCVLCGVGFTMSLFIGSLAFPGDASDYQTQVKLGVLCGSLLSGGLGALILLRR